MEETKEINDRKPAILYIDDDLSNLTSFMYQFRDYYDISTAQSAADGFRVLADREIDVIIADQRMPSMTGTEFFERALKEYPVPVRIILTGYSDIDTVIDAVNKGGISYYLQKPWEEEEIKLVISSSLEKLALLKKNEVLIERLKKKNMEIHNSSMKLMKDMRKKEEKCETEKKKLKEKIEKLRKS